MGTEAEIRWAMMRERGMEPTIEELVAEDCRQKREAVRYAPPQCHTQQHFNWVHFVIEVILLAIIWRAIFKLAFGKR